MKRGVGVAFIWLLCAVAAGCSDGATASDEAVDGGADVLAGDANAVKSGPEQRLVVMQTLGFTRQQPVGVAPGFDLDGKISDKTDKATCGQSDLTSPSGEKGIDNQFAKLVPLLEQTQIGAIHGLVQNAIEDGGLLIMLQLEGIDDPLDDDDVTIRVRLGRDKPLLGTDGLVLSGQTFHLHDDSPELAVKSTLKNGVIAGGPFTMLLPIVVFDVHYELTIRDALIAAQLTDDGGLKAGLIGGGVPIVDIMAIATKAAMNGGGILEAIKPVLNGMGDLAINDKGECTQLSAVLGFGAVSAFLFD